MFSFGPYAVKFSNYRKDLPPMKRTRLITLTLILSFLAGCSSIDIKPVLRTGQFPQRFNKTVAVDVNLKYLLYLPDDYGENPRPEKPAHRPDRLFARADPDRADLPLRRRQRSVRDEGRRTPV